MSIKLVDSLSPMGSFPVAEAKDIVFADSESLQKKLDDGSLGGGSATTESYIELSEEEYLALSDEERTSEVEYRTYDTGRIFKRGVEFGKETDISSKQDNLSQVKFTMRRNSASEGRYCLIGSSDLSQNLLMCEPYRFQGIFGDGTTSVENKSIIDFMVSFREGVENPDDVLSGFANSSKGFDFVDLLITADETTNTAYAYVDFKVSGAVATGEITKPVLEAESYMDFAESFELTDTYIGTLICKMSDYCKVITEIKDEVSDFTVWSSKKTSEEFINTYLSTSDLSTRKGLSLTLTTGKDNTQKIIDALDKGEQFISWFVNQKPDYDRFAIDTSYGSRINEIKIIKDGTTSAMITAIMNTGVVLTRYYNNGTLHDWQVKNILDDQTTSETSTWSSSKIASEIVGKKTVYRGNQSVDISTGGKLTLIVSSEYSTSAGCYMLLSNYNVEPTLIKLGTHPEEFFKVTAKHKTNNVDTITVTTQGNEFTWFVLQF